MIMFAQWDLALNSISTWGDCEVQASFYCEFCQSPLTITLISSPFSPPIKSVVFGSTRHSCPTPHESLKGDDLKQIQSSWNTFFSYRTQCHPTALTQKLHLDLSRLSNFQKLVICAIAAIPFGQTTSYKQIANQIGHPKAYRAVGEVCRNHSLPLLIPCHRVVSSSFSTTTGLDEHSSVGNYQGGLQMKHQLIVKEKSWR